MVEQGQPVTGGGGWRSSASRSGGDSSSESTSRTLEVGFFFDGTGNSMTNAGRRSTDDGTSYADSSPMPTPVLIGREIMVVAIRVCKANSAPRTATEARHMHSSSTKLQNLLQQSRLSLQNPPAPWQHMLVFSHGTRAH